MDKEEESDLLRVIIVFAFVELVVAALAVYLVRRLLPYVAGDVGNAIAGVLIVLIALIIIVARKASGWTKAALISLPVIVLGGLFLASLFPEERTLYFVVDASENMIEQGEQIGRIPIQGLRASRNLDLGLMVFGGGYSAFDGCEDMVELVEPLPKNESFLKIAQAVNSLESVPFSGPGALQESVGFALNRLADRRGVHQILVLTSGYDSRCSTLERSSIDEIASEYGISYELIIFAVGELDTEEESSLEEFADSYRHIATGEDLKDAVEEIISRPPAPYGPYNSSK